MERILVVIDAEGGQGGGMRFELLKAGAGLSRRGTDALCAVILGYGVGRLADECASYVNQVYVVDDPLLAGFRSDLYVAALEAVCRALGPLSILLGHTHDNLELAPRLSWRLGGELVTDCMAVEREPEGGDLLCTKPIYGGNAVAVLQLEERPQMVTMRPHMETPLEEASVKGDIVPFPCRLDHTPARTESLELVPSESVSLDKAAVIVAGGRGIKTAEGVIELAGLARAFGKFFDRVELGASRPLIDAGLLPRGRQVGQTGERVSPRLYVAVAISGASQHLSGMTGSRKIIAINKDPEAPIFEAADYGVVGPFEDILPALVKGLETFS